MTKRNFKKRAFENVEEFARDILAIISDACESVSLADCIDEGEVVSIIEDSSTAAEISEYLKIWIEDHPDIFSDDVIGYAQAMAYLLEYDPSLSFSLEVAEEFGYDVSRLSSEILATLLQMRKAEDEFYGNWDGLVADIESISEDYKSE